MDRDNQQPSSYFDKGWLAGIIDGEGCIQLARQPYRGKHHYRPMFSISNTNPHVIDNIVRISKANDLPVYVMTRKKAAIGSTCPTYVMQIIGIKRMQKWLEYIGDSLVGKDRPLQVMREYIEYRLSLPKTTTPGVHNVSEKDEIFKERMTQANRLHKSERLND